MSNFSIPGSLSKSFDIEKNYRAHKVFTEYERYRKRFINDMNGIVDESNYVIEISNDPDTKKYIRPTSPKKISKLPNVELTPELIERFRNSNSRTEKGATYNPKLAAKLLADTKKYTFRMAPINRTGNQQKKVDRYPMYHPKSIKNISNQYIYFSENANTVQLDATSKSFSKFSNSNTPHQNTDESSIDSFSNPPDIPDNLFKDSRKSITKSNEEIPEKNNKNEQITNEAFVFQVADDSNNNNHEQKSNEAVIIQADDNNNNEQKSKEDFVFQADDDLLEEEEEQKDDVFNFLSKDASLDQNEEQKDETYNVFEEEEEELSDDDTKKIEIDDTNNEKVNLTTNEIVFDTRPSNCGNSPDGSSDFVVTINAQKFLEYCSNKYGFEFNDLTSVPQEEYESFRTNGFNWAYFKELPKGTNIRSLTATLHLARMLILVDFDESFDPSFADGIVYKKAKITEEIRNQYPNKLLIGSGESAYADYFYDERPINCLRNNDPVSFMNVIREGGIEKQRKIIRIIDENGLSFNERSEATAAAMILALPGMRIIDFDNISFLDKLVPLLNQKVIWNGVFEYVNFSSNGNLCAWKYSRGKDHLLIASNFAVPQNTAHIICNDCPEVPDGEKNIFVDILTETKYFRDPIEVKTKGLCVILYEYEAQIFEY